MCLETFEETHSSPPPSSLIHCDKEASNPEDYLEVNVNSPEYDNDQDYDIDEVGGFYIIC